MMAREGNAVAKCALVGCNEKPIAGFKEIIDAGDFNDPNATLPGMSTAWCKGHEEMLRPTVFGKRGVWLRREDLDK
jgi:hypothetical protein